LAFGTGGDLFVTSANSTLPDVVRRYNGTTGAPLGAFTQGGPLDTPMGLGFGPDGYLYVGSDYGGEILKYNGQTGAYIGAIAHPTPTTSAV
jgi:hypothetical protein